jgi:hypothetical protein
MTNVGLLINSSYVDTVEICPERIFLCSRQISQGGVFLRGNRFYRTCIFAWKNAIDFQCVSTGADEKHLVTQVQARCVSCHKSKRVVLCPGSNILNINLDPPVVVEDRQLAVLAAQVVTLMRKLMNAQRWGQATVAKAEAARGQTTINQKVAAKMFKILL